MPDDSTTGARHRAIDDRKQSWAHGDERSLTCMSAGVEALQSLPCSLHSKSVSVVRLA